MTNVLHFLFFLASTSLVSANTGTCYSDLKLYVTAWEVDSKWTAQPAMQYNISAGSAPGTPEEQRPFGLQATVNQCDTDCGDTPYVEIIAYTSKPETKGPPGYDYYPGVGYYKYHTRPATWDDARKVCDSEGTHLGVINSEEESRVYAEYLLSTPILYGSRVNNLIFVGFHDRFVHGEYLTIFDQSLSKSGFTRWMDSNQPDNLGGDEFCGSMERNGGLNDLPCDYKQPFICEQELC